MVNFEEEAKESLLKCYTSLKSVYSMERKELISDSTIAEAYAAYKAFGEVDDRTSQDMGNFFIEYLNNEKRHEYRYYLASIPDNTRYKDLVFKFADSRKLIKGGNEQEQDLGLNNFKNALYGTSVLILSNH